ncbi:hypothetical protein CCHL11_09845 [Colletotrichum chlorophyti]|uniref:Uncharacterized protein n=1 Tax=Colletotrichum chlorophyti TaxID=708187 RepID=A0A1Q8RB88_9PEZI|nr:hypothetical protein CCHL11_09845 [Colletotrichum chlorophyti]
MYASLITVESKCIETENAQNSANESSAKSSNGQWQDLAALHRTLRHEHHDFFSEQSSVTAVVHSLRHPPLRYRGKSFIPHEYVHQILEPYLVKMQAPPSSASSSSDFQYDEVDKFNSTHKDRTFVRQRRRLVQRNGQYSSGTTDYIVEGTVNGIRTAAAPDTGSDDCVISSDLVSKLGLQVIPGTGKLITLANNKATQSPGVVRVLWKFANEQTSHNMRCWVLPNCSNDFVLGSQFLKVTETLTTFFHRVKKLLVPRRLRVRLIGEGKQRLLGSFNNRVTGALADTGSDIMLVSAEYVRRHGLYMRTRPEDRVEVELADGSRTRTVGTVRKATWSVGDKTVQCDFHVLDNMPVPVILSKDYLFKLEVFSKHADSFFDTDLMDDISLLCGVRLVEEKKLDLDALEADFMRDGM